MPTTPSTNDEAKAAPMLHEADIGSGERSPGQIETDKIVGEIPKQPHADDEDGDDAGGPADRG